MKSQLLLQGESRRAFDRFSVIALVFVITAGLMNGCKNDNVSPNPNPGDINLMETLQSDADFETLFSLIEGTSLANTLAGNGPFTVFAPDETAFDNLPSGYLEGLSNEQKLQIVRYHVYSGELSYDILNQFTPDSYETLHGDELYVWQTDTDPLLNGSASVTEPDIEASNGVIHAINQLLLPDSFNTILENLKKRRAYDELVQQLEDLNLDSELEVSGPFSFMAPHPTSLARLEDDLFIDLTDEQWAEIFTYHIVQEDISGYGPGTRKRLLSMAGDSLFLIKENSLFSVNFNEVMSTIGSSNGYMYNLDGVLLPDKYVGVLTLMDKRYDLTTFRSAFAAAHITGDLYDMDNEYTIFAPKNNSTGINNLPAEEDDLAEVLKYHVLPVRLTAAELQDGQSYTTWQGDTITITKTGNAVTINGTATIKLADLTARNGIVHVIDGVLTVN